jgi:mono/diheme cytochrome c family protein
MVECRMPRVARWAVVGMVTLAVAGSCFAAAAKKPSTKGFGTNAKLVSEGKKLYDNLGCGNCHQVKGQGGAAGPKLDGTGGRRDAKFLTQKLKNPKFNNPNSVMPPIGKPDKDTQAVVAYMLSLK